MHARALLAAVLLAADVPAVAAAEEIHRLVVAEGRGSGPCPGEISVSEHFEAFEGGFRWSGTADLAGAAGPARLMRKTRQGAIWSAPLDRGLGACRASAKVQAGMEGGQHLELRFAAGRVTLMVRLGALRDANGQAPVMVGAGLRKGSPVWQWAGTD